MRCTILASALCLLLPAAAPAQWSQPVTLAESIAPYGAGPKLLPAQGDTMWALWVCGQTPLLRTRCFAADSWLEPESPAPGAEYLYWPAGIADDSGRPLVAFYEGSYPVGRDDDQDTWGVYTTTRTGAGWTEPELAHAMLMTGFPYDIRLGRARGGGIGMAWDENAGGINGMDSVMFSRWTGSGWTPRRCLAAGRSPDINCSHASLIPGDSSDFFVAFCRWTYPDTNRVEVWELDDSLVRGPTVFAGAGPLLSRSASRKVLTFRRADSLFSSVDHGTGWEPEELVATGLGWGTPGLCTDTEGWAWTCWPDSSHQAVLASYDRGTGWSEPETVATFSALGAPRIASDDSGVMHCVWLDHEPGYPGRLRHALRTVRPGIGAEPCPKPRSAGSIPAIVRGILVLPRTLEPSNPWTLISALGRRVMSLLPGPNDVSGLAPGVYFVRGTSTTGGGSPDVGKVVVTE